jgi:hypothetical protein
MDHQTQQLRKNRRGQISWHLKTGKNKSNQLLTQITFYAVFQAAESVGQCAWMVSQLFVQHTSGLVGNLLRSETLLKQP